MIRKMTIGRFISYLPKSEVCMRYKLSEDGYYG